MDMCVQIMYGILGSTTIPPYQWTPAFWRIMIPPSLFVTWRFKQHVSPEH